MHRPLTSARGGATWAAVFLLWAAAPPSAQPQTAHIGMYFPAGAKRGETVRIAVGGQQLADVTDALVSGDGVTARFIEVSKTLTGDSARR